jgi:dihydropteroate synthase
VGGDAAIHKECYRCGIDYTDILLLGSKAQIEKFIIKMKRQPGCFKDLASEIESLFDKSYGKITIDNKIFDFKKDFLILGILNVTPDSFSDSGKFLKFDDAICRVEQMIKEGANVIDVGGESTKPGSDRVGVEEEIDRTIKVIKHIRNNFDVIISIDSYKPEVIKEALKAGATIINDINNGASIFTLHEEVLKYNAYVISMMNKGKIAGSEGVGSKDIISDFLMFKNDYTKKVEDLGISKDKLIFDPGIGFGLSDEDISKIIKYANFNFNVCYGLSRKSYLGRLFSREVFERDELSNSISLYLMLQGVKIFRTHDPKGLSDIIKFYNELKRF